MKTYNEYVAADYIDCLWVGVNAKNAFGGYVGEELWCVETKITSVYVKGKWLRGDMIRAQKDTPLWGIPPDRP